MARSSAALKCSSCRCCAALGRKPAAAASLATSIAFATELKKLNGETSSLHRSEQRARLGDDELDLAQSLISALQKAFAPLESMTSSKPYDFAELAHRHQEV